MINRYATCLNAHNIVGILFDQHNTEDMLGRTCWLKRLKCFSVSTTSNNTQQGVQTLRKCWSMLDIVGQRYWVLLHGRAFMTAQMNPSYICHAFRFISVLLFSTALRHSTNGGDWKDAAARLASSLVNVRWVWKFSAFPNKPLGGKVHHFGNGARNTVSACMQ